MLNLNAKMAPPPASSPLSSPPIPGEALRELSRPQDAAQYRVSKQLPYGLSQNVQYYLEEGLFSQAFSSLLSITSNSVSCTDQSAPVLIPPPSYLAVAATLSIHPRTTTRTNDREKWNQAHSALRLLKSVNSLVGPINAQFHSGFAFRKFDSRSSRRSGHRVDGSDGSDEGYDNPSGDNDIKTTYARSQSLWTRAEDFWHLVGWAFNCASLPGIHASRWKYYRLLLDFLLDVLEEDWRIRTTGDNPSPEESLLWEYIELSTHGHARERRILRAIFADGNERPMREFRPVFTNELQQPRLENETARKLENRDHVNIEQEEYGDYLGQDDDDVLDSDDNDADAMSMGSGRPPKRRKTRTRTPSSKAVTPRSSTGSLRSAYTSSGEGESSSTSAPTLGDQTSINLRLRLLRLLTWVSAHETLMSTSPTTFPDLEVLLVFFVEFIRPLSIPIFAQIVLPSPSNPFDSTTLANLCEATLQSMLEHSAPSRRSRVLLSQEKLAEEYLPFAASKNGLEANARVSILLESLTRIMASSGILKKNNLLMDAMAEGVDRRWEKAGKKSKKRQGDEAVAWDWLQESGKRIIHVVDTLKDGQRDTAKKR